ncbi:aquaporin-like protein [Echria macrotheca]|uniref:Aquaporin-like protein n=1 Tax=Echria macrotheca TaxID=438768 RepID=A0AAJ0F7R5_9PEZI|nr:aquaporin-like protein [Echria macrotheca]
MSSVKVRDFASEAPPQPRPGPTSNTPAAGAQERRQTAVASFEGTFAPGARPPFEPHRAVPWYRDRAYYLDGWTNPVIWKSAICELVGTAALVFVGGQVSATIVSYGTPQIGAYIGISNIVIIAVFIYAVSPASGGHLNPMISFTTMLTGMCPCPRAVLYMCGQLLGGALGGAFLSGVWGRELSTRLQGGGCFYDSAEISVGRVFLNEIAMSFVLLLLAFGVGLDPRQALLFGPKLGPLLVGVSLGLTSFAGSGMIPGYPGAQMNPARCFACGVARRDLGGQWIWWFGPAIAGMMLAVFYNTLPPHHAEDKEEKRARVRSGPEISA